MISLPHLDNTVKNLAQSIEMLVLDVDGVMSDGKLYFGNNGEELKTFHTQDGLGIKLLQNNGVKVAIITGRKSNIVQNRASNLGIEIILQGRDDKLIALREVAEQQQLGLDKIAYMGDDLPDLSAIQAVKFGITVANGHDLVKQHADWISNLPGGNGAVREACELILNAQSKLETAWQKYLK